VINKIKKTFKLNVNKKLLSNVFSLGVLQIANYIIPLLTLPYLVRVIGVERIGLLAFVTSITVYFMMLSDYGFNLSATKQISDSRELHEQYSKIFNEVLGIKLIIVCFSFVLF
jgi:PST family polysaccharide transporter